MGLILTVTVLFCACDRRTVYSQFEHASETGWEKADTIDFYIPPMAESGTYREEVGLRIDTTFPFLSLTMEVSQTIFPEGRQEKHTLTCPLVDKNGNMKGAGVSLFLYTFPLHDLTLNRGDSVHVSIVHCMKREIMTGVTDVGISLKKQ